MILKVNPNRIKIHTIYNIVIVFKVSILMCMFLYNLIYYSYNL